MIIFIPIKEKSQRVPGKNFRNLMGKPLYRRCLDNLKNHTVYIDTDSQSLIDEINNDKTITNVYPYLRRKDLIGHEVSVCDLIKNFIVKNQFQNKNICQIHVTSPFLKTSTLEKAFKKLDEGYDSVASCNAYQNRLWRKESYGYCPVNHNPMKLEQTQDLPMLYEENSLFYIFNSEYFLKTNSRIGVNPFFYVNNYPENVDIDTEDDWQLVETLCTGNKK